MIVDFSGDELLIELKEDSTFCSKHTSAILSQVNLSLIAQNLKSHRLLLLKLRRAEHESICSTNDDEEITKH